MPFWVFIHRGFDGGDVGLYLVGCIFKCVCVWFLGVVVCEWRSVFMVVGLLCVVEHGFFKK